MEARKGYKRGDPRTWGSRWPRPASEEISALQELYKPGSQNTRQWSEFHHQTHGQQYPWDENFRFLRLDMIPLNHHYFKKRIPELKHKKINCFDPSQKRNIYEYFCSKVDTYHENAWHSVVVHRTELICPQNKPNTTQLRNQKPS